MAYMNQEKKKEIASLLKKEFGTSLKKRGFSYSLGVRHHSTIVMTISKGTIDFLGNYNKKTGYNEKDYLDVNVYHIDSCFIGEVKDILNRALKCLNNGNWDKSDIMTDYFNVGWYVAIQIGKWDKPYLLQR
jgi:hypothetical protein